MGPLARSADDLVIALAAMAGPDAIEGAGWQLRLRSPRQKRLRDFTVALMLDAPGIAVGTPVRRSGVRIGEVTAVDLDNETGEVRVEIAINKRYNLWTSDRAVVNQDLLSRDTTIDFMPQSAGTLSIPPSGLNRFRVNPPLPFSSTTALPSDWIRTSAALVNDSA